MQHFQVIARLIINGNLCKCTVTARCLYKRGLGCRNSLYLFDFCLSIVHVLCDKTKVTTTDISIAYESAIKYSLLTPTNFCSLTHPFQKTADVDKFQIVIPRL